MRCFLQVLMLLFILHGKPLPALGTAALEDLQTILGLTPLQIAVKAKTPSPTKLIQHAIYPS